MDAVIYAAQLSSSFFSSLAVAVEGFLDLFIVVDSNSDNGGDDDTSLNSRSLTLGGGEKRIPSGALSAIVLWCDSEVAKFSNVFGSSRLLGSLALSPPGIRRQDKEGAKVSLAKEREVSVYRFVSKSRMIHHVFHRLNCFMYGHSCKTAFYRSSGQVCQSSIFLCIRELGFYWATINAQACRKHAPQATWM
jgi:hypothetical protein